MGIFVGGGITIEPGITITSPVPILPGSLYFSNGETDGLTVPSASILNLTTTTNFTIECWIYPTAFNTTTVIIGDIYGGTTYWHLSIQSNNLVFYWTDGIDGFTSTGHSTINTDEWTNIAVSVADNYVRMYVGGVSQEITGELFFSTPGGTTNQLVIGNQSFNTYDAFLGYITNVRLNNTTAVYTNDGLTPIVPLTNMAGTTLLLLVEGNAPFFDSSVLDNTVTVLGSVAYDTQYPQ